MDTFVPQAVTMPEISEENDSEDEQNLSSLAEPFYENVDWQRPNYEDRLKSISLENLSQPKLYHKVINKY